MRCLMFSCEALIRRGLGIRCAAAEAGDWAKLAVARNRGVAVVNMLLLRRHTEGELR